MVARPPVFRPAGHRPRKAWERPGSNEHLRQRGRAGVRDRQRILAEEPLCRICLGQGRSRASAIVDHIKPLAWGGGDERSNKQALCAPCHDAKSAQERASKGSVGGSSHPDWLQPSAIPLTIVCGPPCSGKSTYVRRHASADDIVIDLDTIRSDIDPSYTHWAELDDRSLLGQALRIRNARLGDLCRAAAGRRAWFIVSAPTAAERSWWQGKLRGRVVLLEAPQAELERRAIERGTPNAIVGIERWLASSQRPWDRLFRKRR